MSYSNREKLMNYVQTPPPQNDNYVALIILASTVVFSRGGSVLSPGRCMR